jgi:hypothetical protein
MPLASKPRPRAQFFAQIAVCNNIINVLRTVTGQWQSNWCHTAAPGASALAGINARSLLLSCMPLRALDREVASPLPARVTLHLHMQLQLQLHVQLRAANRSCTRRGDDTRSGASTPTGINARALLRTPAGALPGVRPPDGRRAQGARSSTAVHICILCQWQSSDGGRAVARLRVCRCAGAVSRARLRLESQAALMLPMARPACPLRLHSWSRHGACACRRCLGGDFKGDTKLDIWK